MSQVASLLVVLLTAANLFAQAPAGSQNLSPAALATRAKVQNVPEIPYESVRVDPQDNIWAVDEGSNMVIKFNPQGRVVMTLGRRPEPADAALPSPAPDPANPGTSNV